ncbi:MAG: hypothetical protein F6K49_45790 [Moorea sp. SIO3I6]|nr:hypothetical protein [Moorena sp. SIO3I6]
MQKYFYDSVYVNSCPLFPVPCSLFPTSARSLLIAIGLSPKTKLSIYWSSCFSLWRKARNAGLLKVSRL